MCSSDLEAGGLGRADVTPPLLGLVCAAGVYGGYFGAAQGIILISLLGIFLADSLQRLNGTKNVLALTVNAIASVVFIATTNVDWKVVGTIALGYENVTLVLKSGANPSGLVKSETADELVLDSPEDGKLTVKKADIVKRQRGLSAMPESLDKLMTRRELRDLVEYLSTLK